jgi:putative hydrolase of the HAD superfamily
LLTDLKAIIFDLDGTLYVSDQLGREINRVAIAYIAGLKETSSEQAAALIKEMKTEISAVSGLDTTLSVACMELGGDLRELHRRFADQIRPELFLKRDERVVDLLKILAGRYELYLYTNNNLALSKRIMELLGVSRLFREVFTIEDSWLPKPDRTAFIKILHEIGRAPEQCMFVGDRYDVDLRLPATEGCAVFLSNSPEELLGLLKIMNEENI